MLDQVQDTLTQVKTFFNNAPNLVAAIQKFIGENDDLKKQVESFRAQKLADIKKNLIEKAVEKNGTKVIASVLPVDAQGARDLAFQLRAQLADRLLVVIGAAGDAKPTLTVALTDDLVAEGLNAGKMIREAAKLMQGGGGGQPHFATAGGKNMDGLKSAVDKVVELAQL